MFAAFGGAMVIVLGLTKVGDFFRVRDETSSAASVVSCGAYDVVLHIKGPFQHEKIQVRIGSILTADILRQR